MSEHEHRWHFEKRWEDTEHTPPYNKIPMLTFFCDCGLIKAVKVRFEEDE